MAQQTFPQKFGKYILLRKMAMGGMAEIFRGKTVGAEGFEKDIVIKRILPHYTEDEDFVKMFIDEATIAAKLQHANIVQIFDFNQQDGSYYIAMEYVEGKDLKNAVEDGIKAGKPFSPQQCVWIIMEVSKGLHYAHTKSHKGKPLNIVHRDISPQNAMISYNGEVKLMDFGIAKAASRSTKTVAGTVKGKCAYMSPEQARGKPLDGRSDLFALGVVLWEMLTHKRLFLGDSDFVTLSNVLKQEAPPPSSINPDVPPELDAIVLKCLDKDRDNRHKDVEQFNRDLTKWFYATVEDLDEVAIGPYMKELYAEDLALLAQQSQEERTMAISLDDVPGAGGGGVSSDGATVALPMAGGPGMDPQAAKTILDDDSLTADKVRMALMQAQAQGGAVSADAATRALAIGPDGNLATGAYHPAAGTGTGVAQASGSKTWLIVVLVLLLLGGGGAAAFFLMNKDDGKRGGGIAVDEPGSGQTDGDRKGDGDRAASKATLLVKFEPSEAKATFTVNGAPTDDGKAEDLDIGKKVVLIGEAEGYERFKKVIEIDANKVSYTVRFKKVKEQPTLVSLVIKASDPNAKIIVDGKQVGVGTAKLEGEPGSEVKVTVKPATGDAVVETFKYAEDKPFAEIKVAGAAGDPTGPVVTPPATSLAEILVKCEPGDATVTANAGQIVQVEGAFAVRGVVVGQVVKVKCEAKGYRDAEQDVTVANAKESVTLELKRREVTVAPKGPAKVRVNARPWGKCSVAGKPPKTTPFVADVTSGKIKISCSKGGITKTKTISIKAGATKSVVLDLTGE
jgi:tRNA A-37 threonylcarbamoyl transferase component Bud32